MKGIESPFGLLTDEEDIRIYQRQQEEEAYYKAIEKQMEEDYYRQMEEDYYRQMQESHQLYLRNMIESKSLMIGDKVLVKVLSQIPNTYTVHTWAAEDYLRDLLQVKPIPLTAEILEKNGWIYVLTENEYRSPEDKSFEEAFRLQAGEDENDFWWIEGMTLIHPINYVHTLQHALRLCGLEILADNFQI